jgi:hypothetical protein
MAEPTFTSSEISEALIEAMAERQRHPGTSIWASFWDRITHGRGRPGGFAFDLEEAARLLRDGNADDLAAFASRSARSRAEAAIAAQNDQPA